MASGRVYKRGKGWYIDLRTGRTVDGKPERLRFRAHGNTRAEAKQELDRKLYQLQRMAARGGAADNRYPLDMLLSDWSDHINQTRKSETAANYVQRARRMIDALAVLRVDECTPAMVEDALGRLSEEISNETVNKCLARFRQMIKFGIERGLIASDPTEGVKPLPDAPVKVRRALSPEEAKVLLEESPPGKREIFRFLLSTGLRRDELVNLRWQDVDLKAGLIRIMARQDWSPKSKAGVRSIPLTDACKRDLQALPRRGEFVFMTSRGTKVGNNLLRNLHNAARRMLRVMAGLSRHRRPARDDPDKVARIDEDLKRIDLHSLRYTFATTLINQGADPKTVQRLLGHETLDMTLRIYAQYSEEVGQKAVMQLPF